MRRLLFVLLVMMVLPSQADEITSTALYYRVSEPGVDPYLSRWLITGDFLRIDEGNADDNFILVDRKTKTVYSVIHRDRTVLEIPFRLVSRKPPRKLKQETRIVQDDKMPLVGGERPLQRALYLNGTLCYSVVSVERLLPDAVKAMAEYRQIMAGEHAKNIDNTPPELQQPCELVLHIFNPLWLLAKGLPIQEWDTQGKAQALLDYKTDETIDSALFLVPEGYRHYQTQTAR